jgi:hypothetical protein
MGGDLSTRVAVVTGAGPTKPAFGTAFEVGVDDGGGRFYLTCAHVARQLVAEGILVAGAPASLIAAGDEQHGIDIAVLYLPPPDESATAGLPATPGRILPALPLRTPASAPGDPISILGARKFDAYLLTRPLAGSLGEEVFLAPVGRPDLRVLGWDVMLAEGGYVLQPGYSGSPVLHEPSGSVIGVVSHMANEAGSKGVAISVAGLAAFWPEGASALLDVPAAESHGYPDHAARTEPSTAPVTPNPMVNVSDRPATGAAAVVLPQELKRAADRGRLIPVIGAGVSFGAAGLPGWADFLRRCVTFLNDRGRTDVTLDDVESLIRDGSFEEAGRKVQDALRGIGGLAQMLRDTFDVAPERIGDRSALEAVWSVRSPMVLTTNYDRLLEMCAPIGQDVEALTWQNPVRLLVAARGTARNRAVVHLHGVHTDPDSVILGVGDYGRLSRDDAYAAFTRSLWTTHTLLYVGASTSGIGDPDFTRLFAWGRRAFPDNPVPHYALMLAGTVPPSERQLLYTEYKVEVIEYGPTHAALPSALAGLAPPLGVAADRNPGGGDGAFYIDESVEIPRPDIEQLERLVTAFGVLPSMRTLAKRNQIVRGLPEETAQRIPESNIPIEHVMGILEGCFDSGSFARLLGRVRFVEGPGSIPLRRLLYVVRELFPELVVA